MEQMYVTKEADIEPSGVTQNDLMVTAEVEFG
jgi:hypothetical protein